MLMALAASMARRTSISSTSRPWTATMPWLFMLLMWLPETPVNTELISTPDMNSASSTAFLMDSMVLSILTTAPLRSPSVGEEPSPMMSMPVLVSSATTAVTFVVPISRPVTMLIFFAIRLQPSFSLCSHSPRHLDRHPEIAMLYRHLAGIVEIDDEIPREVAPRQVGQHGLHAPELRVVVAEAKLEAEPLGKERKPEEIVPVDLRDVANLGDLRVGSHEVEKLERPEDHLPVFVSLAVESRQHGQVCLLAVCDLLEGRAVAFDEVQAVAPFDEGHGFALRDLDDEPVREIAPHGDFLYPVVR